MGRSDNLFKLSFQMKKQFQRKIFLIILNIIFLCVFLSVLTNILFFTVRTSTLSMEPDIPRGSIVCFTKIKRTPGRGDVVLLNKDYKRHSAFERFVDAVTGVFTVQKFHPYNNLTRTSGDNTVRRIVAVPGDTVYVKDYIVYVKPSGARHFQTEFELSKKKYNIQIDNVPAVFEKTLGSTSDMSEFTLSDYQYFVLADNRISSVDSRLWGTVTQKNFTAVAVLQFWPFDKARMF